MYSYEGAGEFDFKGKMKRSLLENFIFYLVTVIILIAVIIYYVGLGEFTL